MKKNVTLLANGISAGLLVLAIGAGIWKEQSPTLSPAQDFYEYVNHDWLAKHTVPKDSTSISAMSILQDEIDKEMFANLEEIASGKKSDVSSDMQEAADFYQLAKDFDAREAAGVAPVRPYLEEIERIASFDDLIKQGTDRLEKGSLMPFNIVVIQTAEGSKVLLMAPDRLLGDAYFYEDSARAKELLKVFEESTKELLQLYGYDAAEAQRLVADTVAFDKELQTYTNSTGGSDIMYKNLGKVSERVDFAQKLAAFLPQASEKVKMVATNVDVFFSNFDMVINEQNFQLIKSWMLVMEHGSAPVGTLSNRGNVESFSKIAPNSVWDGAVLLF